MTIHAGRPLAAAAPSPDEIRPSIPFAPRLQRNVTRRLARARTPPGRGSASRRPCRRDRRRGTGETSAAWAPGSVGLADRGELRRDRVAGPAAGVTHPSRQSASPPRSRAASADGNRDGIGADDRLRRAVGRLVPAEGRIDHHLPQAGQRCQPQPQGLAGRHVAEADHRPRARAPPGAGGRSSRTARRRGRGRAPPSRTCDVGSARIGYPAAGSERRHGRREALDPAGGRRRSVLAAIRRRARRARPAGPPRPRGGRRRPPSSGRSPRPSSASGELAVTSSGTRLGPERFSEGDVELHRAGPGLAAGRRVGPAGHGAEVEQPGVVGLVRADLAEPAHRLAVQLQLVDGLPRADPAQLRGPVGGQRDQRARRPRPPRRRLGGGWPLPFRTCTGPRPAGRSTGRRRARRSRRSARRR